MSKPDRGPGSPEGSARFLRRHGRAIAVFGALGIAAGLVLSILNPASYRSEVGVLITRLAAGEELATALEREATFVNSRVVRDAVRASIPTAPNTIMVTTDDELSILRLTARSDTPDEALRIARSWAAAFIAERRTVLVDTMDERRSFLETELERFVERLAAARAVGDESEVARLEAERDLAAAERIRTVNDLSALEAGAGAEIVENATKPTERSGVAAGPAIGLGALAGVFAGWLWSVRRDRRSSQRDEALDWMPLTDVDFDASLLDAAAGDGEPTGDTAAMDVPFAASEFPTGDPTPDETARREPPASTPPMDVPFAASELPSGDPTADDAVAEGLSAEASQSPDRLQRVPDTARPRVDGRDRVVPVADRRGQLRVISSFRSPGGE